MGGFSDYNPSNAASLNAANSAELVNVCRRVDNVP